MARKYNIVSSNREHLVTMLNTESYSSPSWAAMGRHVTDSSIESDWSTETNTDILGNTYSTAKTAQMSQTFSGNQIVAGDEVMGYLCDIAIVRKDAASLIKQDLLIVHQYLQDADGNPFAERYPESMVIPTANGGEGGGQLVTDIDVTYGGKREVGTISVSESTGKVTFVSDSDEE